MCVAAGSVVLMFFFFKQERAYEMRISDWSSDVCSSDLAQCHEGIAGRPRKAPDQDVVGLAQAAAGNLAQHPEQHVMGDQGGGDADRRGQREIGRASCRERECQYVQITDGAVSIKNKKIRKDDS